VIGRKKSLFLIQLTIFFVASFMIYNTYRDKNEEKKDLVIIKTESSTSVNSFTDVEYSGFDLNGNRYVLKAANADFKTEKPELINMQEVIAKFYLKDDTILTVTSNAGIYNNLTLDMNFKENVRTEYLTHSLVSDLLSYSNLNGKLVSTGNVKGKSVDRGEFSADNVEYDLSDKTLNFSMFGTKQVNVKIKN
jgi:hypothetical protein